MKRIDSPGNPLIKSVRRLARARRREAIILIEGRKLVAEALEGEAEVQSILVSSEGPQGLFPGAIEVEARLFERASGLDAPDGVLALAVRPSRPLEDLPEAGLLVVSVGIQLPGNLGAVARVAEAASADALVVVKGSTDPFGPKVIRGSMGSVLRLPVFEIDGLDELRERGYRFAALAPHGGTDFRDCDWRRPLAILLGREGSGLPALTLSPHDLRVSIPMKGRVESLNVATAAALVLYEATRP
ncbi:MAG TPA: RNA methyltransferase [Vicinamibacteria bacterium]|nr:RNA methyltransferase [Vicinamibacteria bacterium]